MEYEKEIIDYKKKYDYLLKIILLGDTGVGKTNFLIRSIYKIFKRDN